MTDLSRYRTAQDDHATYAQALAELRRGRKTSHWMWFVLPQLRGLGRSAMAHEYGIADLAEARAYLADDVLGARLRECCTALLDQPDGATAVAVLGSVDAMKLRSALTLFHRAAPEEALFTDLLGRYFDGVEDDATLALLDGGRPLT